MNSAAFLRDALNSSSELEYHLIVARDTEAIPESDFVSLISQTITVRKMLYGLLKRLPIPERDSIRKRSGLALKPVAESLKADGPRQVVLS